ncbi:MAG: MMPL family transporter [Actinobacteria bacterium]|nr:MMPL family transporter [Actinomycetota bacterium]MCL5445571.1 MMPL family transporter [Actinomycetota bacterium]
MATYLYALGAWAFRRRRIVLGFWLLALVVVAVLSQSFARPPSTQFTIPGTQSQQAIDLLNQKFPAAAGGAARIVFSAPAGHKLTEPSMKAAVEATLLRVKDAGQILAVTDPFTTGTVSKNAKIAYADAIYKVPVADITSRSKAALAQSAQPARSKGIEVAFAGGLIAPPSEKSSEGLGIIVAYVVLTITFGAMLAAGLPLITALIGVAVGILSINALGAVITLSSTAPILATMIGLAVGIDYALFILHRYRESLADGFDPVDAAARATATAGGAVVFAGLTVVIALSGLAVVNIPFLTVMGLAAAGTVIVAVLIALTLLPALVGFAGSKITAPKARTPKARAPKSRAEKSSGSTAVPAGSSASASLRWVRITTGRPVTTLFAGLIVAIVIAAPVLNLRLGLPDAGSQPVGSTARTAYNLLEEGFGPGFNGPLTVVVDAPNKFNPTQIAETAVAGLKSLKDVQAVSFPIQNPAKDLTIVSVTPKSGPTSPQTSSLVNYIRAAAAKIQRATGVRVLVTGQTAVNLDVSAKLSAALPVYLIVVVGLALILLLMVFRSLLVPIKAVAGFLLSIAASLGIVVYIFQEGHFAKLLGVTHTGPIVSFLPILLVGVLFGLAMDYEVFLVSRMRESFVRGAEARSAVREGFDESGRVVVAAALIMISVFSSFVLTNDLITKSIGLTLAAGVAIDAFIVRMTLVPAVIALTGRHAWWIPGWLDRLLPNLDIEGVKLKGPVKATQV